MEQTTRSTLFRSLLLIASFVLLAACAGPATTGRVVSVAIDQSDFDLAVGGSAQLTVEVEVEGAVGTGVVWSSGAESVATVSASGLVTAVAEGSATITARSAADATKSDALTVTVVAAGVVSVSIDQPDGTVAQGGERALSATVVVAGATDDSVAWSSADDGIATVSPTGVVTGIAIGGPVDITATSVVDPTKFDTVAITVVAPGDVTLSGLTAQVVLGSRVRLDWDATGATGFDVYAVDASLDALQVAGPLGSAVRTVTIDLPVSTRMTLRVVAHGVGDDVQRSVVPINVVTSATDFDPYTGGGRIPDAPIPGTLRQVLAQAASGAVVGFAADITEIDLHGVQFVAPIDAHLYLARDVTISGPTGRVILRGIAGPTYAGGDAFTYRSRVVYVAPGVTATLDHVTVTGGTFIYFGAGVFNAGDLTIRDSLVTGNRAWYLGGGIYNAGGTLSLIDTVVTDNVAAVLADEVGVTFDIRNDPGSPTTLTDGGYGGGLANAEGGTVTAAGTTFSDHQAKYSGGSIYNLGVLTMTGSDVRDSSADRTLFGAPVAFSVGGGIYTEGVFTLSDAEIAGNETLYSGGGLFLDRDGAAALDEVHFAGNVADFGGGIRHEYWNADGDDNLTRVDTTFDLVDLNVARSGVGHDYSSEGYDVAPTATPIPARWVAPTGADAPHTAR